MPMPRKYASAAQRQAAYRLRCKERAQADPSAVSIPGLPGRRRWEAMCEQALHLVEQASREMQLYYDQRSDAWRESERGEDFSERMESVTDIGAALAEVWLS